MPDIPEIPIDRSVADGVCVLCGDPVDVVGLAADVTGYPMPTSALPENPVLVRMCDECRVGFEAWKAGADATAVLDELLSEPGRRSDA